MTRTLTLITGGTGVLGRQLIQPLLQDGHSVRVGSRGPRKAGFPEEVEWASMALPSTPDDLDDAVQGVDTLVHCASSPVGTRKVDVEGTRQLVEHARAKGVQHVLYISIVGIDDFPFPYYRAKLEAERIVEASGVPFTILRATQFHELLDQVFLPPLFKLPLAAFVPTDLKFQVIDSREVASRMVELVLAGPSGRAADVGGPEVRSMGELARGWAKAHGVRRRIVHLPLPGRAAAAFREGKNTCPYERYGRTTWEQYLARTYGEKELAA